MRQTPGTRLLYGVLPLPGTIGQLAQWEIGTYLLVCTGLMAVLMTCRMLRTDEDEGLVEVEGGVVSTDVDAHGCGSPRVRR